MNASKVSIMLLATMLIPIAAEAQTFDTTPYQRLDVSKGTKGCSLMSQTAFQELQKWNQYQWNLNNSLKKYNTVYGTTKGIEELNKSRTAFLAGQRQRKAEYTQAYSLACGKGKIDRSEVHQRRVTKRGERLGNRIMRATIQRSYNQAVLKKNPPSKK